MNTVLEWLVIGMAVLGLGCGAALIATVMSDLFDRRNHHA